MKKESNPPPKGVKPPPPPPPPKICKNCLWWGHKSNAGDIVGIDANTGEPITRGECDCCLVRAGCKKTANFHRRSENDTCGEFENEGNDDENQKHY